LFFKYAESYNIITSVTLVCIFSTGWSVAKPLDLCRQAVNKTISVRGLNVFISD